MDLNVHVFRVAQVAISGPSAADKCEEAARKGA